MYPLRGLLFFKPDLLEEIREMFRKANTVSRPEKTLILGFIAGSRANPCPHLGELISIKLGANKEMVKTDEDVEELKLVETYFQMNYLTGKWKLIYRNVDIDPPEPPNKCDESEQGDETECETENDKDSEAESEKESEGEGEEEGEGEREGMDKEENERE